MYTCISNIKNKNQHKVRTKMEITRKSCMNDELDWVMKNPKNVGPTTQQDSGTDLLYPTRMTEMHVESYTMGPTLFVKWNVPFELTAECTIFVPTLL